MLRIDRERERIDRAHVRNSHDIIDKLIPVNSIFAFLSIPELKYKRYSLPKVLLLSRLLSRLGSNTKHNRLHERARKPT